MKKSELLVDYCQRCGAELGSFDCCQSSTNKLFRKLTPKADFVQTVPSANADDNIIIE